VRIIFKIITLVSYLVCDECQRQLILLNR